jgi:hypothetical protein
MSHTRCKYKYLAGNERIFTFLDIEDDLSVEQVDRDRSFRSMRWHTTASCERDQGQAQRPVLDERSRAPAVAGQQSRVDHLLIALQVTDLDVPVDRTMQRRHVSRKLRHQTAARSCRLLIINTISAFTARGRRRI